MPKTGQTHGDLGQAPLGTAQSFSVLAGSTVTNTGATTVHGSLGVDPGLAISGFPPGRVTDGTIHAGDAVAHQAASDVVVAYDAVAGEAPTLELTGQDLGGQTLTSGVYHFASSAELTGALTLDAQHDPNAVFVSARMFPANAVVVPRVAELPTCQNTLQSPPPLMTRTDELLAVVSVLAILKMKTAEEFPWALSVRVPVS